VGGAVVVAPVLARRWPKEEETSTTALLCQRRKKKQGQPLASGSIGIFFFKFSKPWFSILGSGKIVRK
jgi:hypothetical protein